MHKLPKALTFMGALLALTFCAVSCKTDDDDEPTMYTVTVSDSLEHGKVTADKSSAEAGAKVKLTATADEGYELDSYSVKDEKSNTITVTDGTFTMPKSNVTVSATFKETADQKAAAAVIAKITAIGTVAYTAESKAKIYEARTAYDALTDAQKELVPEETLALLIAAESTYAELKAAAEQQSADPETATYTVKHLQQNIADDNYTLKESETKTGTVGQLTAASAKSYDGFTAQTVTQATIAASGTTVEIKYDRNTYTVTFDADGGSTVASQTVRYGATATEPTAPTKEATATTRYTFAGWYNGDTEFDFATPITDDITLKAKWNETALYTVTLTGGANATISGGNTTQEGLSDAMETVTFTANDGYYFEDFTDITSNGITATRTSDSVVTVSGTPTGNASITIPDATEQQATTYSITLTGPYTSFTLVMEYQEGDTWNDMATKYPDYIKIYNKWPGFHTDGFIYYKDTGKKVSPTDVIDSNKTYEIQ